MIDRETHAHKKYCKYSYLNKKNIFPEYLNYNIEIVSDIDSLIQLTTA